MDRRPDVVEKAGRVLERAAAGLRRLLSRGAWLRRAGRAVGRLVPGPETPPTPPVWVFLGIGIGAVLLAGIGALMTVGSAAPAPPFLPVDEVDAVGEQPGDGVFDRDRGVLFLRAGEAEIRAFVAPPDTELRWCAAADQIEADGGRVWDAEGRSLTGGTSLERTPTTIHDGLIYHNPEEVRPGPPATDEGAAPACQ